MKVKEKHLKAGNCFNISFSDHLLIVEVTDVRVYYRAFNSRGEEYMNSYISKESFLKLRTTKLTTLPIGLVNKIKSIKSSR